MVGAVRHNSRLVIVTFSCGSARAKAGGERYYYRTGGESGRGLAKRHGLISFGGVAPVNRYRNAMSALCPFIPQFQT
jgi:hypothetical protein